LVFAKGFVGHVPNWILFSPFRFRVIASLRNPPNQLDSQRNVEKNRGRCLIVAHPVATFLANDCLRG
jgi:hypothetical protein